MALSGVLLWRTKAVTTIGLALGVFSVGTLAHAGMRSPNLKARLSSYREVRPPADISCHVICCHVTHKLEFAVRWVTWRAAVFVRPYLEEFRAVWRGYSEA